MIRDREEIIKSYFPKHLHSNQEFQLFINMTASELSKMGDLIELFSQLSDVDRVPNRFLKLLSELVGYEYREGEDPAIQRQVIARMFSAYEQRGTEADLLKALNYGYSPKYVQGDITLHEYIDKQYVGLQYADQFIFTLSKSKLSSNNRLKDHIRWTNGVINIVVSKINPYLEEAIRKTIPAGIRYYFDTAISVGSEQESVSFHPRNLYTERSVVYDIDINKTPNTFKPSLSKLSGIREVSGHESLTLERLTTKMSSISYLKHWDMPEISLGHPIHEDNRFWTITIRQYSKGIPQLSTNATLSGKHQLSGTINNILYKNTVSYNTITQSSQLPISNYLKAKLHEPIKIKQNSFEIIYTTEHK